jgi:hypothetical protein
MLGRMQSFAGSLSSRSPVGIVKRGLVAYLDASDPNSYSGSGTTWKDLSGVGANGTINNLGTGNITWVSDGLKSYFNWASASPSNYVSSTTLQNYLDLTIVFSPDFTLTNDAQLVGLIGSSNNTTSSDKSLRFNTVNGTGPWKTINPDNADAWASTSTTFYVNGTPSTTSANLATGWNIFGGTRTNTTNGAFASPWAYYLGTEGYASQSPYREFRGKIALICLYNRGLSAAEQTQNFNALRPRFGL